MKKIIKKFPAFHKSLLNGREKLRILYNTKTRSRFLWHLKDGDNTLSLDYPLTEDSIIFDVGAYKGVFTNKINKKYKSKIYAFEPLDNYYNFLVEKFKDDKNIRLFNFGLLDKDSNEFISNIDGASSIYNRKEGKLELKVKMKSMTNFLNDNSISKIDLLYMNIEGSEYRLLSSLIKEGRIKDINHLQIQFHNFIDGSKKMRVDIRKQLKKTHRCVFNFPFIWERWDIK